MLKRKPLLFQQVDFIGTAVDPRHPPALVAERHLPQIVFVGRSNVGKSSLINWLCKRRKLARTSSSPGKTQALQYFRVDDQLDLVDFPGYGYAKAPKAVRSSFGTLCEGYFENPERLLLAFHLIDSRHGATELDFAFQAWAQERGLPVALLFTKIDQLPPSSRKARCQKMMADYAPLPSVPISSKDNLGRGELLSLISGQLKGKG